MSTIIDSVRAEFVRHKALAEGAIGQLDDRDLALPGPDGGNSIIVICWHISGNLRSRFTEFLTTDGEKPWRQRDEEFEKRAATRAELLGKWAQGWEVLFDTLGGLRDDDLQVEVTIRHQRVTVHAALHRALAHVAYHVGQVVYVAKARKGDRWTSLSIPLGQSEAANRAAAKVERN